MPRTAIEDWLSLLKDKANKRNVPLNLDTEGRIFHFELGGDRPVLGKVRISEASNRNFTNERGETHIWQRFDREQEKIEENPNQRVCSIQLDIKESGSYIEEQDHFLFIPGEIILQETYSQGDQKIHITGDGRYRGELARYNDDWEALFDYAEQELPLHQLDENKVQAKLNELADDSEVDDGEPISTDKKPAVWIEKTQIHGEWKQPGETELSLGRALISPQEGTDGRDIYTAMREAKIGDIVLHLIQDKYEIIGASVVTSDVITDYEFPKYINQRWDQSQRDAGGYLRKLTDYTEFESPILLDEELFENPEYIDRLKDIREKHSGLFYTKRLNLVQGGYLTNSPEQLSSIFASTSPEVKSYFAERGLTVDQSIEPVDSYDSITEATDDIKARLQQSNVSNRLDAELTGSILEDWSNVLTNFNPDSMVTQAEEVRLQQIRDLYGRSETQLRSDAATLGSGDLNHITPPQTLFVVSLRLLQKKFDIETNVNQVKGKIVLNREYDVKELPEVSDPPAGDGPDDISHPLLSHLDELSDDKAVWKFTAPPEYWLTAVQHGTVSFESGELDTRRQLDRGDLVFLHSQSDSNIDGVDPQQAGIFAVGVLGQKAEKEKQWWNDETTAEPFTHLINFDRLFVTSNVGQLDLATPVGEQTPTEICTQLHALTAGILDFATVEEICEETNGIGFPAQGAHKRFQDETEDADHDRPRALLEELAGRLQETATLNPHKQFSGELSTDPLEGLYFPDDSAAEIIEQIEAALSTGKHIILTGPPGTGKTEIARRVCSYIISEYPYLYSDFQLTTATADWSTFDTVGGYMPEESEQGADSLSFNPGIMLNRLKDHSTELQKNEPVIIDELNRADIDKAFGQLFTLLSGQSVQLPYTREGQEVELLNASNLNRNPDPHQYVVPESWRIFATMNTYDKTSLYEMSYAFMRRFTFIRVEAPEIPDDDTALVELMENYTADSVWDIDPAPEELETIGRVWRAMNHSEADRAIGPAIVEDMVSYVAHNPDIEPKKRITRAIISYIFPQLEGVPKRKQIVQDIMTVDGVDSGELEAAASEMLQVTPQNE